MIKYWQRHVSSGWVKMTFLLYQSVKLHYTVTFQMLHCVATFVEKWEN